MGVLNKTYYCMFVRVPRTGTGSLGTMLNLGGGHMPIMQMKSQYEKKPNSQLKWEEIFKFGFVRNPYTRFVSAYYNLGLDLKHNINDFIQDKDKMDQVYKEEAVLLKPEWEYLCDNDGNVMVDFVGRFENLHDDWNFLFEKFGYNRKERDRYVLVHSNRTDRHKEKLTPEAKKVLYPIYKKDFEIFNYER